MYDYGQNEGALAGSALPMEIQYGDVEAFVERAEAEALPAMIYAWEPWPSFLSKGRFIRVGLTETSDRSDKGITPLQFSAKEGTSQA